MANTRLSDGIAAFSEYAIGAYSEGTRRGQRSSLDQLLSELGNLWVKNITPVHIDRYVASRKAAGVHPHTIRNNLTHIKMFCEFARARKYASMQWEPVGRRRTPRVVPWAYTIVPVEDFPKLLDAADNPRDRAAIAFGIYTLCRQSELAGVRIKDVDLENDWVCIRVLKSGLLDQMPISLELHIELSRWLQIYRECMGKPLDPEWKLFPALVVGGFGRNEKGQLLPVPKGVMRLRPNDTPSKIQWMVQHAMARLGYPSTKEGLHTLRRSGARARFDQLVSEGYDGALREVQALLHHKNAFTTEHYLGLTRESQRRDTAIRGRRMYGPQDAAPLRLASE